MVQSLRYLTFLFVVLITVEAKYIPCKSYISFSYDDSKTLGRNEFKTQMNFIRNVIGGINYPDRLRTEGVFTAEFNWNSGLSISQMQSAINNALQTPNQYSLLQEAANLYTSVEMLDNPRDPIAALIFISDTSDAALQNADRWFSRLSNIQITFVLLGQNVSSLKLRKYSTNFIFWPDLTQPQPNNWDLLSYHAFGCSPSIVTSTVPPTLIPSTSPTTTSTQITDTTSYPTSGAYYPCQTWISVIADISNLLTPDQFQTQLNFLKSVISQTSNPERIRTGKYDGEFGLIYNWDPRATTQTLQDEISETKQTNSSTSVLGAIRIIAAGRNQNHTIPDSSLIFITDTSNATDIQEAAGLYKAELKNKGYKLTFILAGRKAIAGRLLGFDDVLFFDWQSMNYFAPAAWDISKAFRCNTGYTASTLSTISTSSSPYVPCRSWIHFGLDDSNVLNEKNFNTQLNFISSVIGTLNHPERIEIGGSYSEAVQWNSGLSIQQIQNAILAVFQAGSYSLRRQFSTLLTNLQNTNTTTMPVGALIFVSDTSDSALMGAEQFFNLLQNVRITFVMLGSNVNSTKLMQFSSNFIFWTDLSRAYPDNWDNSYFGAFGCL